MPYWTNSRGFGLMQLDPPLQPYEYRLWHWQNNAQDGATVVMSKFSGYDGADQFYARQVNQYGRHTMRIRNTAQLGLTRRPTKGRTASSVWTIMALHLQQGNGIGMQSGSSSTIVPQRILLRGLFRQALCRFGKSIILTARVSTTLRVSVHNDGGTREKIDDFNTDVGGCECLRTDEYAALLTHRLGFLLAWGDCKRYQQCFPN